MTRESRCDSKDSHRAKNMRKTFNVLQTWFSGAVGLIRIPFRKNSVYPRDVVEVKDALKTNAVHPHKRKQKEFVVIEINEKRTVILSPFSPGMVHYPHITGQVDLEAAVGFKSPTRAQLALGITFAKGRRYLFHLIIAVKFMDAEMCGVGRT